MTEAFVQSRQSRNVSPFSLTVAPSNTTTLLPTFRWKVNVATYRCFSFAMNVYRSGFMHELISVASVPWQ